VNGTNASLKDALFEEAARLGFAAVGVAPIDLKLRREYYLNWISEGQHGEMQWMERNNDRRLDPSRILPEARSIICLGLNYYQPNPDRRGKIAKYALGLDYHDLILDKLQALCDWIRGAGGEARPYVDTGPVLEKPLAVRAGLGWQAKNTMLVNTKAGNWLFLGEIFTTLDIPSNRAVSDHCGTCSACIDACPTNAITAPYKIDARRCIAYLTIEHKGAIPVEFRAMIGDRLYGCDDCLDVCPWNRWAQTTRETGLQARPCPDLREMLGWEEEDFRNQFRNTPVHRLKLPRWLRNICVVLGNIGKASDLPALKEVAGRGDPLVAEHAEWAIARIEERVASD
jgi:epoxyqueuosine reductase